MIQNVRIPLTELLSGFWAARAGIRELVQTNQFRNEDTVLFFRTMPDAREGNAAASAKPSVKDFLFGEVIGEASFSTVYLAKELKSNEEYASKYVLSRLWIVTGVMWSPEALQTVHSTL